MKERGNLHARRKRRSALFQSAIDHDLRLAFPDQQRALQKVQIPWVVIARIPGYFFGGVQVHPLEVVRVVAKREMVYQPDLALISKINSVLLGRTLLLFPK